MGYAIWNFINTNEINTRDLEIKGKPKNSYWLRDDSRPVSRSKTINIMLVNIYSRYLLIVCHNSTKEGFAVDTTYDP